jgi:hypothetical protein
MKAPMLVCSLVTASALIFCAREPSAASAQRGQQVARPKPFKGQIYKSHDGRTITMISADELELTEDGVNLVCKYTRQDDVIRAVVNSLGTTQSVYYSVVPEGLKDQKGNIFYDKAFLETLQATFVGTWQWEEDPAEFAKRAAPGRKPFLRPVRISVLDDGRFEVFYGLFGLNGEGGEPSYRGNALSFQLRNGRLEGAFNAGSHSWKEFIQPDSSGALIFSQLSGQASGPHNVGRARRLTSVKPGSADFKGADVTSRRLAAYHLSFGDEEDFEIARAALQDPDAGVRYGVLLAIRRADSSAQAKFANDLVALEKDADPAVRALATGQKPK